MSNPITPYLLPGVAALIVLAFVFAAAHRWDANGKRRDRES